MSEKATSRVELLKQLREQGYSTAELKGMGITWKEPSVPTALEESHSVITTALNNALEELDADARERIAHAVPVWKLEIYVDMLNGVPAVFHNKLGELEGKAGTDKVWVDTRTGRVYATQVDALHDNGVRVTDKVVRRQTRETYSELRLAWTDDNGRPVKWYDSNAENKIGEPLSDAMLDKVESPLSPMDIADADAEESA